jgi:hypothetical protein
MNLMRYQGLNYPEYDPDEVNWTTKQIKTAARSGRPDFVRRACLTYNGGETNLHSVLTLADLVMETVCDNMGALTIGHSWGLAPLNKKTRNKMGPHYHDNDHGLLPPDYALVAKVNNVPGAQPVSPDWEDRIKVAQPTGIYTATDDGRFATNYDIRHGQFVQQPGLEQFGLEGNVVLVDIEPRLLVWRSLASIAASLS